MSPRPLVIGVLVGCLAGCASDPTRGYSFAETMPQDVKTVSIPVFENYTYDLGLEALVTEAVIKELQRSTPLKVVSRGAADSELKGIITKSELRRLSVQQKTGFVQELGVIITVDFEWKDVRSGEMIISRREFAAADTFVPSNPSGERLDTGRVGAANRLARDLVWELRSNW
ncbi:MAG: hypothetical protein DYG92_11205 [Leptolyngbya sp. PLA1]|nr:hypothetical protein [Leptolyngbya sp. PLA1]